jgi:hypothetical protein
MQKLLTPNTMQFIGGLIAALLAKLVFKDDGFYTVAVFATGNALKSAGDMMQARKDAQRQSSAPPAP